MRIEMSVLLKRFEEKYIPEPNSGCFLWLGQRYNKRWYGKVLIATKPNRFTSAQRVSYELYKGPIPDGLWVLHKCDNPICVNPDHLFLGTAKDNNRDAVNKGRAKFFGLAGDNINATLSPEQVYAIRADKRSCVVLAREYNISPTCVQNIRLRITWSSLPERERS